MEQKALELLDELQVKTLASVRTEVGALSGGQRQSVAIARSLIGNPKLVILDEPTAALGVAQTAQVLALVKRLKERGLGVILISHNLSDVFEVADRIVVLRLGRNGGEYPATPDQRQRWSPPSPAWPETSRRPRRRRQGVPHECSPDHRGGARPRRRDGQRAPPHPPQARGRELGSLRVLIVLALIWLIFTLANDRFSPPSTSRTSRCRSPQWAASPWA